MRTTHFYRRVGERLVALLAGILFFTMPAFAGTSSYAGHQVIAGDFNGDGWGDLLFQALPNNNGEALIRSMENGALGQPIHWADQSQGTNWNAAAHHLLVGDFNGDGKDDLFLQAVPGLMSVAMLSTGKGFVKAPQVEAGYNYYGN